MSKLVLDPWVTLTKQQPPERFCQSRPFHIYDTYRTTAPTCGFVNNILFRCPCCQQHVQFCLPSHIPSPAQTNLTSGDAPPPGTVICAQVTFAPPTNPVPAVWETPLGSICCTNLSKQSSEEPGRGGNSREQTDNQPPDCIAVSQLVVDNTFGFRVIEEYS